ncbi:hypothetical protein M438DRAFT_331845 [Aureobasidium pullulans EXF-150]|uniref:Uncharacterized protein n=1 Tax=Aureobasidium pullulans EXF-150 TaxID=1043002 RepID=A0A074Y459_AURPU|nr:uncharacterized protein M438DRAFT_331845 [Aureobasidium pullulans EXF-150]KEQ88997.1 hypothetical protein M438DRAFT_331845 [Aureobasidium pullulans EXF-150]
MIVHDYDPMWLQAAVGIFLFHSICTAFIFTTNPFQYNRPLDLSLITHHTPQDAHPNIAILLRKTRLFPKTTCSGPAASHPNSSLPERFITQALVTQPIILHHHNPVSPKRTPRSAVFQDPALNHMDILAIRSICRTLLPVRNKRIHPPPLHILRGTEIIIVLEPQQ